MRQALTPLVEKLQEFLEEWKKCIIAKLKSITGVKIPSQITRVEIAGGCSRLCIFKDVLENFVKQNVGLFSVRVEGFFHF